MDQVKYQVLITIFVCGLIKFTSSSSLIITTNESTTNSYLQQKIRIPSVGIIGGHFASPGQFPFLVSIQRRRKKWDQFSHACGGTLISDRYVLTAAHCIDNVYETVVLVGAHNQTSDASKIEKRRQVHAISSTFRHPKFVSYDKTVLNDIGIIRVKNSVESVSYEDGFGNVKIIKILTSKKTFEPGTEVTSVGWGNFEKDIDIREISDVLKYDTYNITHISECPEAVQDFYGRRKLCVDMTPEKSISFGDSGGPLLLQMGKGNETTYVQIGITSHLSNAYRSISTNKFTWKNVVFVKIVEYQDWIESITGLDL